MRCTLQNSPPPARLNDLIIELNPQICAGSPGPRPPAQPPLSARIIRLVNKRACFILTLDLCLLYAKRSCSIFFFPHTMVQPTAHCNVMAVGSELPRLAFLFGQVCAHVIEVWDYRSVRYLRSEPGCGAGDAVRTDSLQRSQGFLCW